MNLESLIDEYVGLNGTFADLTDIRHPETGRCCPVVHGAGVPDCVYGFTRGRAKVWFTPMEAIVVAAAYGFDPAAMTWRFERGLYCGLLTGGEFPDAEEVAKTGFVSKVLGSTSWPTLPVIGRDGLMAVAVSPGCIGEYAMDELRRRKTRFAEAWSKALGWGLKPYYGTWKIAEHWQIL